MCSGVNAALNGQNWQNARVSAFIEVITLESCLFISYGLHLHFFSFLVSG